MKIQNGKCKRGVQIWVCRVGQSLHNVGTGVLDGPLPFVQNSLLGLCYGPSRTPVPTNHTPNSQLNPNFAFCILNFVCIHNAFAGKGKFRPFPPYSVALPQMGQEITYWCCPRRRRRSRCRRRRCSHPCWDHSRRPCWGRPEGWPGHRASRRACRTPSPEPRCRP